MFHIGKSHGIYENNCRMMTNGMSYADVRDLSQPNSRVSSAAPVPTLGSLHETEGSRKFPAGIEAAVATGSRRTKLVGSGSLSGSSPTATV